MKVIAQSNIIMHHPACIIYVTRSHKKGIESLGLIRAAGKEVKDNYYVIHLTPHTTTGHNFSIF